jgi:hypothetical protein
VFDPWLSQEKLGFGPVGSDEQAAVTRAAATTAANASVRERDMALSSVRERVQGGRVKFNGAFGPE